jgi:hypothetical protein
MIVISAGGCGPTDCSYQTTLFELPDDLTLWGERSPDVITTSLHGIESNSWNFLGKFTRNRYHGHNIWHNGPIAIRPTDVELIEWIDLIRHHKNPNVEYD